MDQLRRIAAPFRKCIVTGCGKPVAEKLLDSTVPLCGGHAHEVLNRYDASLPIVEPVAAPTIPEAEPVPEQGTIYYLLTGTGIKIGWTSDLARRLREYAPGDRLIAIEPGTRKLERARHQLFNEFLVYGREWFADCDPIREHVARVIEQHGPPPVLEVWRPAVRQDSLPGTLKTRRRSDRRHEHDGSAAVKRPAA